MPHIDLPLSEIPMDTPVHVEHAGMEIVVIRTHVGVSAFEDSCPHALWPLSQGELRDGVLECPGHGWEFDPNNGTCLNAPTYCLTPVAVSIKDGTVRLEWPHQLEGPIVIQITQENSNVRS